MFEVSDTRLAGRDDHGGHIVEMTTSAGMFGMEARAFTQTDARAVFGKIPSPDIPTKAIGYVTYLEQERVSRLVASPASYAKRVDDELLSRAASIRPDALRFLSATSPGAQTWNPHNDKFWIRAAVSSRAQLVALPSIRGESSRSILARMNGANQEMRALPEQYRKHVAPTLRLDDRRFNDTYTDLVGQGVLAIFLEFHGLTHAAANLRTVSDVAAKVTRPPYTVGINVPRRELRHSGSGNLLALSLGVQVCAPQVFHGDMSAADEADPEEDMWWFHRPFGAYVRAEGLPDNFGYACSCPDHHIATGHIASNAPLFELLDSRRRHETWAHMEERERIAQAISGGRLVEDFLNLRPRLRNSRQAILSRA